MFELAGTVPLLGCRVVVGHDGGHRTLRAILGELACRAEIDQYRAYAVRQKNIGGLDVAVQNARSVQGRDAAQQRQQEAADPHLVKNGLARNALLQRFPLTQIHDHVGRTIGLYAAVHANHRRVVDTGQQSGLFDETGQADAIGRFVFLGQNGDGIVVKPRSQTFGQKFFDGACLPQ